MIKHVKAKWVAALRSGEYKQGEAVLHSPNTNEYCCLGVLCEVAVAEGIVTKTGLGQATMSAGLKATLYDNETEFLPRSVADWAGLPQSPELHGWAAVGRPLIDINDVTKLSFSEIADLIEEYL